MDSNTKPTRSDTKDPIGAMHLNKDVAKRLAKEARSKVNKLKKKYVDPNPQAETPEEIMQSAESAGREPSYIAQEHGHRISFRAHSAGNYKTASLNEQSGKYAKYWLLNAKDTNGNGWGIAAHTAKDNMKKFIGRPLVVTASSWHGASEYGDQYEHPYLPTNDITAILDHQEKFRVGSIVDVVEDSHGDWYANVEMLPKFANSRLPPFCSPAIYQLDASEAEGQISKWEALHLAALTENPAYGARIALLKGTCVGTGSECKVQFKSAKQLVAESPCHDNYEMIGTKSKDGRKVPNCVPSKQAKTVCPKKKQKISRLKQRLSSEDPTEKVIREVKDPEKKKDLLNRLDEKPNEYGPKNYGATKPKNFGKKIGKLKQRLAAVGLKNVDENPLGRRQKTVGTPAEVRQAFVEGRSLRSGNRMEDGVRTADAHQTDGENLFLFGNKILTKDGKGGYITNAKEWMGKGYKNATLKEYRALGIPVDTKGIIDPSRKYYSPDGKLLKTKGLEGNLNKEDITISKEQLFEGEVRLGDSTKAKPKVVDPNARRPLDNRHNLREFASSSRKRLTGDASATRTPPYSETATQPEDAMLSNELLGFSKEHGLEKTFGKKTKTDSVFNLGIKGEYSKVPGPDTHHIGYKKLFRRPTGINPTSDLKHYRNTKTSPPGNKHQPFFNRGNNAIQLNTDEHTGGEQYAPQGLPSTRGTGRHSVHSLNPHENFKSILHSKLKARLANLGEQNMTYQDSKKVKIHKKKNMEKHDKS